MSAPSPDCDCKIGRNAEKYGLSIDVRRWREDEELSLRDLAQRVNVRITAAVLDSVDGGIVGDPASVYAVLADPDVAADRRVTVQDQLAGQDVDPGELDADFVSYQSVRHHLRNCVGVDTSRRGIETIDEGRAVVEWATDREARVVERTLGRLGRVGALAGTDYEVTTTLTITCGDCGATYRIDDLLDAGGCSCE